MTAELVTDVEALTLTLTAQFPVSVRRLWDAFADVRQIEQFWGSPQRAATFTRHDFFPGGQSAFWESAADGSLVHGRWEWAAIEPLVSFDVLDLDAEEFGEPGRDIPATRIVASFAAAGETGATLRLVFHFASKSRLEAASTAGAAARLESIAAQLGEVLADPDAHLLPPTVRVVSDTMIRLSGFLNVTPEEAWKAHQDLEVLADWMSGPEGWTMPVVQGASKTGERYRFEWENPQTGERIGHEGEVLESIYPYRIVLTENPIGGVIEGGEDGFVNSATYVAVDGGIVLNRLMHCPSLAARDALLATGFAQGIEQAYAHLEAAIANA